jgi:hypothetical protein
MKSLKNERGAVLIIELIVFAVVLVVAGVAAFRYYEHKKAVNPRTTPVARTPEPTPDPYAGWKTYKLAKEGLSLRHPPSWKLIEQPASEYDFGGFKLTGPNGFMIKVLVQAHSHDGGFGPGRVVSFTDEIRDANYAKPLYIVGSYDSEANCCDLISVNDLRGLYSPFRSKITDPVPGYTLSQYQEFGLSNNVYVSGKFTGGSDTSVAGTNAPHADPDKDPDINEARKILGSLKYD